MPALEPVTTRREIAAGVDLRNRVTDDYRVPLWLLVQNLFNPKDNVKIACY